MASVMIRNRRAAVTQFETEMKRKYGYDWARKMTRLEFNILQNRKRVLAEDQRRISRIYREADRQRLMEDAASDSLTADIAA